VEKKTPPKEPATAHWREQFVRLAYRFLWNWSDAEDAVQDALVLAETKREQVRDEKKWWAWITRIVINQCRQVHRRRVRSEDLWRSLPEARTEPGNRQTTRIEQQELATILKKLITELPDRQRTAVVLRHLEGMEYEDIARIMELSESSVRVHVFSGREALRKMILARYPEWAGAGL
jgi:RNA polymerase sigma-70 factor (ECF subfamily)